MLWLSDVVPVMVQAELLQLQAKEYGGVPPPAVAVKVLPVLPACTSLKPEIAQLMAGGRRIVVV